MSGWEKKPWLLPSQLASHLSREPPRTLAELYTKMEKYARSDADHRRRVEQRKLMRQQQGWPQGNQSIPRHNPQYIFLVEPSQRTAPHPDTEPYMTPPAQSFNSQPSNHRHDSNRGGKSTRGRGRGRGRGQQPPDQPRKFFCHFHGAESDHTTNHCPKKKKTLDRMEAEKKAKLAVTQAGLD